PSSFGRFAPSVDGLAEHRERFAVAQSRRGQKMASWLSMSG
ncbi:MAG: hypothetical protein ACI80F_001292, partial [Natronomonas sp.]